MLVRGFSGSSSCDETVTSLPVSVSSSETFVVGVVVAVVTMS